MNRALRSFLERYRFACSMTAGICIGILSGVGLLKIEGTAVVSYLEKTLGGILESDWKESVFFFSAWNLRVKQFLLLALMMLTSASGLTVLCYGVFLGASLGTMLVVYLYSFGNSGIVAFLAMLLPHGIVYAYLIYYIVVNGERLRRCLKDGRKGRTSIQVIGRIILYLIIVIAGSGAGTLLEAYLNPGIMRFILK